MKAGTASAIVMVATLGCGHALASDGNDLVKGCSDVVRSMDGLKARNLYAAGSCLGLVSGVMDTLTIVDDSLPPKEKICYPSQGIPYGQAVRVVLKYLNDHPSDLHQNASVLTADALRTAYSCK